MTEHEYCVILAGGIGSRFWPISNEAKPKQFHSIHAGGASFLQETYSRMARSFAPGNIYIASLARYSELILEQLPGVKAENLILEPYGRNTATTIAHAAYMLLSKDPGAVMVATPADHAIGDDDLFDATIRKAMDRAESQNVLLTLGIVPTRPDTNFGYIQAEGGREAWKSGEPVAAKTFTEKPDAELAKVFVDSGEFLWNSGIFIWKASVVISEMEKCCPEITRLWKGWEQAFAGRDRELFVQKAYSDSPRTSIDYALMEKSDKVWILPAKFKWADIGSWGTLYRFTSAHDPDGNAMRFAGPHIVKDVKGDLIYTSDAGKLTVIKGLRDYMVIDTGKVLMVCPRDEATFKETLSEIAMPEFSEYR